jgi:hypothetical protein
VLARRAAHAGHCWTRGTYPPCWSQTTAPSSASRLHQLPLGRVALHLITVGGNSGHLASLWLRLLPAMISYLRKLGNLLVSSATLAAGSSMVFTAPSYAVLIDGT